MSFLDIFLSNFVTLSLIVGLSVIAFSNKNFDRQTNRYFLIFLAIVLLLDFADMLDYAMTQSSTLNLWRYVTSAIGYTLRPAATAIVVNIFLRRRPFHITLWIPVFVSGLLAFTSPFTHWIFYFSDVNAFMRGPIGYFPIIVSAFYLLLLIGLAIKLKKAVEPSELLIIAFIALVCVFAAVMELMTNKKFLIPGAMIVSCAVYYIFLYVEVYKRDPLTGLLNRRSLYAETEQLSHQPFALISMDLNGLKELNDNQGHQAGDKALRVLAQATLDVSGRRFKVFRTGGDEFLAVGKGASLLEAEGFSTAVKEKLRSTGYMASFGCAISSEGEGFDETWNRADRLMYEDKKNYPHREGASEESVS